MSNQSMKSNRDIGRIVGALFLTLMITYSIGAFVLIDPVLNSPDYLTDISTSRTQIIVGVLLELINGIAYVAIAVLVFPILKQLNESMALAYVGLRIIEFTMQIISDLSPLLLTELSQDFVTAGAPDDATFQALGALLQAQRYWANQMVFITYSLGALIFYYLLYRSRLIPRFLSVWGMIGAPLVLIGVLLEAFGFEPVVILGGQMGLNEIILGIWLIVKGFQSQKLAI